jgi:hypothetical protein
MAPEARELIETARARREGRMPAAESRVANARVLGTPKPGIKSCRKSRR